MDAVRGLVGIVVAAAVCAPVAWGHGGTAQEGYVSSIAGLAPNVLGVQVAVLHGDDRLNLQNLSGKTIVVFGYDGEPYLRFDRGGRVFRNMRSPATYENEDRYAEVELPAEADANAPPVWQQVASGNHFAWHDHRIHWMKDVSPGVPRGTKVGGAYDPW
jgi:hypothetical protein